MIDWTKAEYWPKLRVILKSGEVFTGSGDGIELADNFYEDENEDTFYLGTTKGAIALAIDDIEDLVFFKK